MENNTDLKIVNGVPMMGSRGIAAMTEKDHGSIVVRDIKSMLEQLELYPAELQDNDSKEYLIIYKEYKGRKVIDEIWLNQVLSKTLVTGYSVKDRYKLAKRWETLEIEAAHPRITAPAPQAISASDHILSVARVVAEATASATMKAVMEIAGSLVFTTQALPTPPAETIIKQMPELPEPEFSPVIDLMWAFGISDAACRRLASYSNLPTKLTNGERGHLLVHRESFAEAVFTLIEESTPPTGKRKRWQHPYFGGFTLKVTEANKAAVEAKQ